MFGGLFGNKKFDRTVGNTNSNAEIAKRLQEEELRLAREEPAKRKAARPSFFGKLGSFFSKEPTYEQLKAKGNIANVFSAERNAAREAREASNAERNAAALNAAAGVNEHAVNKLNASLGATATAGTGATATASRAASGNNGYATGNPFSGTGSGSLRRRTRKQRGGAYRGKTMRLPTGRNVLRVTGKTARKLGRVGVYGLKKVGNGVHVVTGLLGGLLKKGSNVVRKMTKRRQH